MAVPATGQQSPFSSEFLTYHPGEWKPHEQADPYNSAMADFVDPSQDPYAFEAWRLQRDGWNKAEIGPPGEPETP
jgi:hypothetical protein